MTSFTKANGFAMPLKWLCVFLALTGSVLSNAQNTSNNFSQVTTNPPQDLITWIYGILNKHNSQYGEGMAVPERIALRGVTETGDGTHTLTFKVQYTRKNNTNYAFDFLTSWSTAVANAGGKLDQLSTVACNPHSGQTLPAVCGDAGHVYQGSVGGEPNLDVVGGNGDLTPYLDNGTDRFFTIYSTVPVSNATITANPIPETDGSNSYLLYTINWTNDNAAAAAFDVVIEFAAHLAKTETGYNGSGYIKGAPYHIKLDQLDGGSLGSQDNNVSVYQNTCDVQTTDATLTTCATPGATVDLTSANITSTNGATVTWYYDADLTLPIDPAILTTFPATNTSVYADVSNGTCESVATVTIQLNPLPTATLTGTSPICNGSSSTLELKLTGTSPWVVTIDNVSGFNNKTVVSNDTTLSVSPSITTIYTVSALSDANGCNADLSTGVSATVTVNPLPGFGTITPNNTCQGQSNGSVSLANSVSGINYQLQSCDGAVSYSTKSGDGTTLSWTGLAAGDYKIVAANTTTTCTNTSSCVTVGSNPLPPCTVTRDGSTSATASVGATVKFCGPTAVSPDVYSYSWTISPNTAGASFVGSHGTSDACVNIVTTTIGSYTVNLQVTNTTTGCVSASTCTYAITVNPIGPYTTYTKGFWGTPNGNFCEEANSKTKTNVTTWMQAQVPVSLGSTNNFTLQKADFNSYGSGKTAYIPFYKMMPGGSTPNAMGCSSSYFVLNGTTLNSSTWNCVKIISDPTATNYGSIQNNLLAQVIAMYFNLKKYSALAGATFPDNVLTFAPSQGSCATNGSVQTIPWCVFDYLNGAGNDQPVTVQKIYDLAKQVLGGTVTVITPSDATAALNAINVGFDKGAVITGVAHNGSCSSSFVTTKTIDKSQLNITNELAVSVYPNPYTSKVNFIITSPLAGRASLQVYNVLGQNVRTVYNGYLQAGQRQTVSFDVPPAMQSMLIYKLQIGNQQITGKVLQAKE